MLKKTLVAVAAVVCAGASLPSFAAALKCEPPVIQVSPTDTKGAAQYSITCVGSEAMALAPTVMFTGEVFAQGTPPYLIKAHYAIDLRSLHTRKVGTEPREDQVAHGEVAASTFSVAALPTQFSAGSEWDASAGVMSIQETPEQWRAFSFVVQPDGAKLVESGVASTPVRNGRADARVVFDKQFSRFAGSGADQAAVVATLGLDEARLVVLFDESRVTNSKAVQGALLQLDKRPKDMSRAWALASRAKFLGLDDEVRYAEQKVAAHNPQHLEEFQAGLKRIQPFTLSAK